MMRYLPSACSIVLLLSTSAEAEVLQFRLEGVVTEVSNQAEPRAEIGDGIMGSFELDTASEDRLSTIVTFGTPSFGFPGFPPPDPLENAIFVHALLAGEFRLALQSGLVVRQQSALLIGPAPFSGRGVLRAPIAQEGPYRIIAQSELQDFFDLGDLNPFQPAENYDRVTISFPDFDLSAVPKNAELDQGPLIAPEDLPLPSEIGGSVNGSISFRGQTSQSVRFRVDSITLVPEPSASALLAISLIILAARLGRQ